MLHKTRGIVFHVTEYSETSVVAKIYTELFGLQSYLINGVRKKNSKISAAALQPLALVDLVAYHKERGGLQRISDIRSNPLLKNIPFDIRKSSILLFMNETLYKSVREEEANEGLFSFIFHAVQLLDLEENPAPDFHLVFLVQLTKFLGFYPRGNFSDTVQVFNLQDGVFQQDVPLHHHSMEPPLSSYFYKLLGYSLSSPDLQIPLQQKRQLVEKMMDYYRIHLSGFGTVKSHKVLEEVWS